MSLILSVGELNIFDWWNWTSLNSRFETYQMVNSVSLMVSFIFFMAYVPNESQHVWWQFFVTNPPCMNGDFITLQNDWFCILNGELCIINLILTKITCICIQTLLQQLKCHYYIFSRNFHTIGYGNLVWNWANIPWSLCESSCSSQRQRRKRHWHLQQWWQHQWRWHKSLHHAAGQGQAVQKCLSGVYR